MRIKHKIGIGAITLCVLCAGGCKDGKSLLGEKRRRPSMNVVSAPNTQTPVMQQYEPRHVVPPATPPTAIKQSYSGSRSYPSVKTRSKKPKMPSNSISFPFFTSKSESKTEKRRPASYYESIGQEPPQEVAMTSPELSKYPSLSDVPEPPKKKSDKRIDKEIQDIKKEKAPKIQEKQKESVKEEKKGFFASLFGDKKQEPSPYKVEIKPDESSDNPKLKVLEEREDTPKIKTFPLKPALEIKEPTHVVEVADVPEFPEVKVEVEEGKKGGGFFSRLFADDTKDNEKKEVKEKPKQQPKQKNNAKRRPKKKKKLKMLTSRYGSESGIKLQEFTNEDVLDKRDAILLEDDRYSKRMRKIISSDIDAEAAQVKIQEPNIETGITFNSAEAYNSTASSDIKLLDEERYNARKTRVRKMYVPGEAK